MGLTCSSRDCFNHRTDPLGSLGQVRRAVLNVLKIPFRVFSSSSVKSFLGLCVFTGIPYRCPNTAAPRLAALGRPFELFYEIKANSRREPGELFETGEWRKAVFVSRADPLSPTLPGVVTWLLPAKPPSGSGGCRSQAKYTRIRPICRSVTKQVIS